MTPHISCDTARRWIALAVDEELPPEREPQLESHLDACPRCRQERVEAFARLGTIGVGVQEVTDEIDDLQQAGIGMIQVDEAAFKEGYPLRASKRPEYEAFALRSFWISTNVADDTTQIHTHMCYSEFNDIIGTIEEMDADVISIETARSGNALLHVFKHKGYAQEIGPGVYDIHSPRVPSTEEMIEQIEALLEVLPARQLWINPDCGLKTRRWEEVRPSLIHMVDAVKSVREKL